MKLLGDYQIPYDIKLNIGNADYTIPCGSVIYDTDIDAVFYIPLSKVDTFAYEYVFSSKTIEKCGIIIRSIININKIVKRGTVFKYINYEKFPYMDEERTIYSICIFDGMILIMFKTEDDYE